MIIVKGQYPEILKNIMALNAEQNEGYGKDKYSQLASALIKEQIAQPEAEVHFLVGGTQTNLTALAAFLRPYEAIIAPKSGHILVHVKPER